MGGGGRRSTNVIETAIQLISAAAAVVPPPWIINRRHHPSSDTLRTNNESLAMSSKATSFFNRLCNTSHCSKSSFFVQQFNFDLPRKFVDLFWVKTRENAAVLDFLAVDNFDFTRKIVKKKLVEKLVKMSGVVVKIEFLDKKLTLIIV